VNLQQLLFSYVGIVEQVLIGPVWSSRLKDGDETLMDVKSRQGVARSVKAEFAHSAHRPYRSAAAR
jgi:hypothetical protein